MLVPAAENPKGMRACNVSADAELSAPNREAAKTADFKRVVFIGNVTFDAPEGLVRNGMQVRTRKYACGKESSAGNDSKGEQPGRGLLVRAKLLCSYSLSLLDSGLLSMKNPP
jgi:hypothetical protein